jgi:hypothetical protein
MSLPNLVKVSETKVDISLVQSGDSQLLVAETFAKTVYLTSKVHSNNFYAL